MSTEPKPNILIFGKLDRRFDMAVIVLNSRGRIMRYHLVQED